MTLLLMNKLQQNIFVLTLGTLLAFSAWRSYSQTSPPFRNPDLAIDQRISNLLTLLTVEEKISLLGYNSPGVPRLGIPVYNWWNESLHGVARAGEATIFPQAIGMAATFNDSLILKVSDVISTEARAKYNLATTANRRLQYMGLTFWSPNINIFRDPRWGRGQETYGEDPFLTASMGVAFVKGLQGNDARYLKASACAKHYAVHSGPEAGRHTFNALVDEKDLRETYLYAFHKLVDAGVESVMCAYNRVNDEPCCTSNTLLKKILRDEWKFKGHVVTDCWALQDIWDKHKVMKNSVEVAAAAVKAGINMDCSNMLQDDLMKALQQKLITEEDINAAITPSLRTQFKLGFYDPASSVPFNNIMAGKIHDPSHIELTRKVAQQSMVMLKNGNNLLPLQKEKIGSILVTGTNSTSADALLGNYHGLSSQLVTFVEGITEAAGPGVAVQYDMGSDYTDTVRFGGLWVSENSDVTVAVIGLTPVLEGEEGDAFLAPNGGDKASLDIPAAHIAFMRALRQRHKKPIVAVVTTGSAVNIAAIEPYADAIILAWYPGEQGGAALADIVFGKVSPAGRLPITFYASLTDLPPYSSYSMQGRTYRYYDGKVLYPFGYGLSYSTFEYSGSIAQKKTYTRTDSLKISVTVKNVGEMDSDEVIQAYIKYPQGERFPLIELKAFKRIHIPANKQKDITLSVPIADLQKWNIKKNEWEIIKGDYQVVIGAHSRDEKLAYSFKVK
jgi:beta-glucosidase